MARDSGRNPYEFANRGRMQPMNVTSQAAPQTPPQATPQEVAALMSQGLNKQAMARHSKPVEAGQQTAPPPSSEVVQALQLKMQDPKFSAWFNSLLPEQKQQVLERLSKDYAGENAIANEQLATAQALRDTKTPEGRQAGRVYVAANPLEHIGAAYKQRQGAEQYDAAIARKKELSDMKTQGLQDVIAAQLRKEEPKKAY